jgi:signal peptidase I
MACKESPKKVNSFYIMENNTEENTPLNSTAEEHPAKISPIRRMLKKVFRGNLKEAALFWLDVALNIIIIVALVFLIRTYFISPFQVYGPSMCNTFNYFDNQCNSSYGEYLIVNKFGYQNFFGLQIGLPQRGDIIVFHPPNNENEFYIKRVIGLPGETVKLKNGKVFISNKDFPDGFELSEPYLSVENEGNTNPHFANKTIFEVPDGSYFVLGDNRLHSTDSRACFEETLRSGDCGRDETPYLTLKHIEGKAWIVLWPLTKLNLLQNPVY